MKPNEVAQKLCLACGMCCNGVIFADVQLQGGEKADDLRALGLALRTKKEIVFFRQPCAAFQNCRCQIYAGRPRHCRQFNCLLLNEVQSGAVSPENALKTIATAQRRVAKVKKLLRRLGDEEEQTALSLRVRRMIRQLPQTDMDAETAHTFSELTIAAHQLNLLLSEKYYPGD